VLWESFLGHVGLFQNLDLFGIVAFLTFLKYQNKNQIFLWVFIVGIILDLVIVRWIGTYPFAFIVSILLISLLDRFVKLIDTDRDYLSIIVFLLLNELIIYCISIINGVGFDLWAFVGATTLNIILAFCIKRVFFRYHQKTSIRI